MIMESVDTLEEEIAREKRALRENVDELQYRARSAVDWRTQVHRHPLAMLGMAAVGGLLLARIVFGRGGKKQKEAPGLRRTVNDARRSAARAISDLADRIDVGDREGSRARRAKHHPA